MGIGGAYFQEIFSAVKGRNGITGSFQLHAQRVQHNRIIIHNKYVTVEAHDAKGNVR
jgi:hypothetical protein